IVQMHGTGCQLVIVAGNHDSVAMLNESKGLLGKLNTQVIATVGAEPDEQVLLLTQRNGDVGAIVCAIPFLRPRDIQRSQAGQSADDKQSDLQQAIAEHYAQLYARAEAKRAELGVKRSEERRVRKGGGCGGARGDSDARRTVGGGRAE